MDTEPGPQTNARPKGRAYNPVRILAKAEGRAYSPLLLLALSGAIGFVLGVTRFATWQVAVESAQVVAGLVKYPADNPFYIYHLQLWTVLHQIGALALRAGISEIALSHLFSGVLGMVSFQALGILIYAFSADLPLAVGAPVLILYTRAVEHGATYPISLMGVDHTYGVIGLSLAVLVVGLLGAGCYRLGGFLLGIAPAVHPSIGMWLAVIVAGCIVWDFKALRAELRPALPYFVAGCAVTAASVAVYFFMARHVAHVGPAVTARYLDAFVGKWDEHRRAASLITVGSILNVDALLVGTAWLVLFAKDLPPRSLFILRAVIISGALSVPLMMISWLPPTTVPTALLTFMPNRLVNLNVLAFVPLVAGLLAVYRKNFWSQLAIAALVGALFINYRSMLWDDYPEAGAFTILKLNPWHVFVAGSIGLLGVAVAAGFARRQPGPAPARVPRAFALVLFLVTAVLTWRLPPPYAFLDRTNNPLMAALAKETRGMVATAGSFHLVQLYTRRPVLIDGGALDTLPYAPDAGPAMERILREVYGIDFFNPPPEVEQTAVIPHHYNKPIWESYSRLKWQELGFTFGVTQVLTHADWRLDLPVAAEDQWFKVYQIPK